MNYFFVFLLVSSIPLSSSVGLYQQCGGEGYKGSTSCDWPLTCYRRSRWFSSCQTQCPGGDWDCAKLTGTGGSIGGSTLAKGWEQCGGEGWNGPRACAEFPCQWRTKWYAQCRPDCPAGWMCQSSGGSTTIVVPVSSTTTPRPTSTTPMTTAATSEEEIDLIETSDEEIGLIETSDEEIGLIETSEEETDLIETSDEEENVDDYADFGRYIVSQMLGSSAFDLALHGFEPEEIMDLYDIVVEHIIELLESEEPGSMERFGAALQSEDVEERGEAWESMYERVNELSNSVELMDLLMADPLFADHWDDEVYDEGDVIFDRRTLRRTDDPCKGPVPDLGSVNGVYGNGKNGYFETFKDALKTAAQSYALNSLILTGIEAGTGPIPDPESRLGAFYATKGYPADTVGNAVHRAIGAIYLVFGTAGEEKIGRVFNDPRAKMMFNKPIKSWYSRCIAEVEYQYWANVKEENPDSFGGNLGKAARPRLRDCIQQAFTLSFCWKKSKTRSLTEKSLVKVVSFIPDGYIRRNYLCQNKSVYCKAKAATALECIVEDQTSHKGGVWKAGPEKNWADRGCPTATRSGTYDAYLNRIAD